MSEFGVTTSIRSGRSIIPTGSFHFTSRKPANHFDADKIQFSYAHYGFAHDCHSLPLSGFFCCSFFPDDQWGGRSNQLHLRNSGKKSADLNEDL